MKFQISIFILVLITLFGGMYWFGKMNTKIDRQWYLLSEDVGDNFSLHNKRLNKLETKIVDLNSSFPSLTFEIRKLKERVETIETKQDANYTLYEYFADNTGKTLNSLDARITKLEITPCSTGHAIPVTHCPTAVQIEAQGRLDRINKYDNKVPNCVCCGELLTPQSPEDGTRYCMNKACQYYEHLCNTNGFLLALDPDNKPYKVKKNKETKSECKRCKTTNGRSNAQPQGHATRKVYGVVNEGCRSIYKTGKVCSKSRLFRRGFSRRVHFKNSKCFH